GDAVQDVVVRVLDRSRRQQAVQVDDPDHTARGRVDAEDVVRLPDIGPDLSVDPFQLVQLAHRAAVQGDGDAARLGEGLGVEEAQGGRAVRQDQLRRVVGQAPAFARIVEAGNGLQVVGVPDEADAVVPGQGDEATVDLGQAFAEIFGGEFVL